MIQLLFTAIFLEAVTLMLILFETPLDHGLGSGQARLGTRDDEDPWRDGSCDAVGYFLQHSEDAEPKIEDGAVNHTDQVLSLYALMVDRLHHDIKEILIQRKNTEAMKKESQERIQELEKEAQEFKAKKAEEIKALEKEKARLGAELEGLEFELLANIKNINVAKANAVALRKQSEGFLLEYDCVLQEKQELRIQLQSLDYQKLSRSASKKNM